MTKETPMRKCVGCMTSKPKDQLLRIAGYEGMVSLDLAGRAKGRGVYVCPNGECFHKAQKRNALKRGLKMDVTQDQMDKLNEAFNAYENKD